MNLEQLKYPIGKYEKPISITKEILTNWMADISSFLSKLITEVAHLSDQQLDTPYRPEGWTIRQVVHHCADSHMNIFIRMKLALTEDEPIVKPYFEERWADLVDAKNIPISPSLKMIDGIHERWSVLLNHMTEDQLARTFIHPEHGKIFRIDECIGIYAWHSNHHLAHITETKKRNNWK